MLIDLTRKPLVVFPETCPSSVVVRSIGNHEVDGLVSYWVDSSRTLAKRARKDLKPDAQIARNKSMLCETRLPLPSQYGGVIVNGERVQAFEPPRYGSQAKVKILPEPFEVASVYVDTLTGVAGTWRAAIRIEYLDTKGMKKSPWVVGILDVTTGVTLSTIAVSGLDANPLIADSLPLSKAVQHAVAPGNAWTKLMDDDT